jgi:hypothetical protein
MPRKGKRAPRPALHLPAGYSLRLIFLSVSATRNRTHVMLQLRACAGSVSHPLVQNAVSATCFVNAEARSREGIQEEHWIHCQSRLLSTHRGIPCQLRQGRIATSHNRNVVQTFPWDFPSDV